MHIHNQSYRCLHMNHQTCFVLCWSIGLTIGLCAGFGNSLSFSCYLYQAANHLPAWPIVTTILPILAVWFCLFQNLPGLIYPIMFLKAFADGVIFVCISYAFGSATWLLGPLLIASDRAATVIQLWFASRFLEGTGDKLHRTFLFCLLMIIAAIMLDHFVIAPYLISLMP